MNKFRNILLRTTSVICLFTAATTTQAQPDFTPEGSVNESNQLVLDSGQTVISPPAVEAPSSIPDVTVNEDGSLDLNDDLTPLPMPDIPVTVYFNDKLESLFDTWYFHPLTGSFSDAGDGWVFKADWKDSDNGFFFINTLPGGPSEGYWAYSLHFKSWVFFGTAKGMFNELTSGDDAQKGWFFVYTVAPGQSQWHFMFQRTLEDGGKRALYTNEFSEPDDWVVIREK